MDRHPYHYRLVRDRRFHLSLRRYPSPLWIRPDLYHHSDTGYHVADVLVDGASVGAVTSFTFNNVTANHTIAASFAINTYTLTYTAGVGGSISGDSPQTVNAGGSGTEVTAVPDAGYHFVDWSDGVLTVSRTDSNVTADISVTANFALNSYTITYTAGPNGTISGISLQTVNYGGSGTEVTAVPADGYHFVDWSDGVLTAFRTDLNVTADTSVSANFASNTYTLTYTAGVGGSISGTSPQTRHLRGLRHTGDGRSEPWLFFRKLERRLNRQSANR